MHRSTAPAGDRFLSEAECAALAKRVAGMAVGGGYTQTVVESTWTGNVRWARNRISTAGDVRQTDVGVIRDIHGADPYVRVTLDMLDDSALEAAVRRAERLLRLWPETQTSAQEVEYTEQYLKPTIWSDATYDLSAEARARAARVLVQSVERAGLLSAGYIQVAAHGRAVMSSRGRAMYYPYTEAQYSVTVRDPKGTGAGWAGGSHHDWTRIDAQAITDRAVEKCLASRNPVALEPGRYSAILEPQAVGDIGVALFDREGLDRPVAEGAPPRPPFGKFTGQSRLGEVVMDERLTVSMDPMDPDLGFVPFEWHDKQVDVFYPAEWVKNGVLTNLAYDRDYAMQTLGKNRGLPTLGAFRLSGQGAPTSLDEMIATTPRGVLVTRFQVQVSLPMVQAGYTRDGVWLVERGKISKPVKNFKFMESFYQCVQPERLEQVGAPVRIFSPGRPIAVPPLKVKDFNFTQLVDAV